MKSTSEGRYTIMATLFCVCLVASNLFETKIFSAFGLTLTGGLLIFPISYIINDLLSEIYGFKRARLVIVSAMLVNLFVVGMAQIVRILPPAPFWDGQAHFDFIFAADLRITIASTLAFLAGSLCNALIMDKMKRRHSGHEGFGLRAIVSTLGGETLDSLVFFPIAFWGVGTQNLLRMMLTQIVLKTLYEIVILPLTAYLVEHESL